MQCITMIHRSVGAALLLCQQACGGHSSTFTHHLSLSFPPSPLFSQLSILIFCLPFVLRLYHSSVFLSLFLVLMCSLITASPLCSLPLTHTHPLSSSSSSRSFTFGGRPFSLVHSLFLLQSLMLISIARLPLFVVDFLIDTKSFTPSSSVSSK